MSDAIVALRAYVRATRPALARRMGGMLVYDAVKLLCEQEGISPPVPTSNVETEAKRLLRALKVKDDSVPIGTWSGISGTRSWDSF